MRLKLHIALRAFLILLVALTVSCRGKGTVQVAHFSEQDQFLPASITVVNWNVQKGRHPQFVKDVKQLLKREAPPTDRLPPTGRLRAAGAEPLSTR